MKNKYVNNRQRMNLMIKKNIKNKTPTKRYNSSQRYLNMYQNNKNEKSIKKNILTPDINKKSIKKTIKLFDENKLNRRENYDYDYDYLTLENNYIDLLAKENENFNDYTNYLSNSIDISQSLVNIENYMNFFYSKNKNPFINKINNGSNEKDDKEKNKKVKIIAKYSYKNKKWVLIEELNNDQTPNNSNINIYWKEYEDESYFKNYIKLGIDDKKDFNYLEEKYNSLILEYNKMKQMFNDLNNKYEIISKKNKESQMQLNCYLMKIKEIEKDKEKYLRKNKKLKEEINKIPYLIEKEMNKFKEETGRKISKKIFELEQENTILKGERYKSNDNKIELKFFEENDFLFNGNNNK